MKFVILALLLAIFIAFVVMVVKAAKNWRWYHITSAVIAMLLAIVLLFPTAGVLKSRQAWHKVKEKLEARLQSVEDENRTLRFGDSTDSSVPEGLQSLSQKLSEIGTEAGRTWRSLTMPNPPQGGAITLQMQTPPPVPGAQPAAPAAAGDELIPVGLVVYGFTEGKMEGLDDTIPISYLGEFKVTASRGNSVTIVPTFPLEPNQIAKINNGARFWSLYEMLPLDGHMPFIAEGSKPDDDNLFGRVNDQLVKFIMTANDPKADQATIDNYLRDGQRGNPQDPESRWVKVTFDEKFTIDVDSPEQRSALELGFFDTAGRAADVGLQRDGDGDLTLAAGESIVMKEEAAKELQADGKAVTLGDVYYVRPLNDYRNALRKIRIQISQLEVRIAEMEYEEKVLQAAMAATVNMLAKGQDEKLQLEQDLAQHQVENTALKQYFGEIREELRQMKESSSALYRSNFELLRQIEILSRSNELTET